MHNRNFLKSFMSDANVWTTAHCKYLITNVTIILKHSNKIVITSNDIAFNTLPHKYPAHSKGTEQMNIEM